MVIGNSRANVNRQGGRWHPVWILARPLRTQLKSASRALNHSPLIEIFNAPGVERALTKCDRKRTLEPYHVLLGGEQGGPEGAIVVGGEICFLGGGRGDQGLEIALERVEILP
jgi:hypothetical protein